MKENVMKKTRMAGLDGLRCIAMMMVVILHFLGKGSLLISADEGMTGAGIAAWGLEALCIVAVNLYMLISGYFLCTSSFKLSRLISLYVQLWIYSVGVGMLAYLFGWVPAEQISTNYFLTLLFPVMKEHYWFMSAYIFLYLFLPFLGMAVRRMNQGQFRLVLALFLGLFSGLISLTPFRFELDNKGYDMLWYVCMFLTAAYIRRFSPKFLQKRSNGVLLYLAGCLGALAELFVIRMVYVKTGSLQLLLTVSMQYKHLFVVLASVGLFAAFLPLEQKEAKEKKEGASLLGKVVCGLAPYTLGVYLLHENLGVRYVWPQWLCAERAGSPAKVVVYALVAAVVVFVLGVCVDYVRSLLQKGFHALLLFLPPYRRVNDLVRKADALFAEKTGEAV